MKNHILHSILILVLMIIMCHCKKCEDNAVTIKKVMGHEILVCDIDKVTETREMKLSELVESSALVRLSNDTNALVGNTCLAKFRSGYIILADFKNKLFLFDEKGHFINAWNPGKGPTEFILPVNPQLINHNIFIRDKFNNKLIKHNLEGTSSYAVKLVKKTGKSIVLNDSTILTIGNSESVNDPYLICVQDIYGNIIKSIQTSKHVKLIPPLVQESVISYPVINGWNIHFPTNDTLMHYSIRENRLTPLAVFHSSLHEQTNKELYIERKTKGLSINNKKLTQTVKVIPEYESNKYYFLSVYTYGMQKDLPWYIAKRKICLVDKGSREAFYVTLVNDFWGNIPFRPFSNSHFWSKKLIQNIPAISLKNRFASILDDEENMISTKVRTKLKKAVSETNTNDNNIIFVYTLK